MHIRYIHLISLITSLHFRKSKDRARGFWILDWIFSPAPSDLPALLYPLAPNDEGVAFITWVLLQRTASTNWLTRIGSIGCSRRP